MNAPLEGLRIVDLSMFMSGPLVTLIAADLGADVIKVESIQRLDGWRGGALLNTANGPAWEQAPSFNWINRNKRGITLNLTDPRGADLLKHLVAKSDIVVENYTPRVLGNFGLGYDELRVVRPDIILLSMPGFGLTGPWRDYTAFAWSTEQMAGINHLTGYEGGPPLFTGMTGGDPLAGLMGALAMFAALNHRRRTGEGQHIDLSQLEASTMFVGDALMEAAYNDRSAIRRGNWHPTMAPHNTFRCLDGRWVAIACRTDADWGRLAALIGHADLASPDSPTASIAGRHADLDRLDAIVAEWAALQDAPGAMAAAQAVGVPAGVLLDGLGLLDDPHLAARNFFIPQEREWVGLKHNPGQPFHMSRLSPPQHKPAPLLGEHTDRVLSELLGLAANELDELRDADVTGTIPLAARHD